MRVQKINNYSQNSYSLNFSGVYRDVYKSGNLKHRNVSWMFRPALYECKNFYSYISDVFKNISKVNVYNYGCSAGYEAYSFILGMFASDKNPEKFFPIIAKDYDETIIQSTNKKILPLECNEVNSIKKLFGNDEDKISDFVTFKDRLKLFSRFRYSPSLYSLLGAQGDTLGILKDKLTDNVNFSVADIRTDYVNIEPENSLVIATNFWPYMRNEDRYALAKNLSEQMERNCYIKVDKFDNGTSPISPAVSTADLLLQNGFSLTPVLNLYKK